MLVPPAAAVLAAAHLATAVPLSSSESSSSSRPASILVVPRDSTHSRTVPHCATYHGTVGAHRQSDIYHVSATCAAHASLLLGAGATPGQLALEATDAFPYPRNDLDLTGALVWLHPTTLDVDPTSRPTNPPGAAAQQLTFSSPFTADEDDAVISLADAVPLPHDDEGLLLRLSPTSHSLALSQLSHLSSHPSFALFSPVVLSRAPISPPSASAEGDRFPRVPDHAVRRVEAHLDHLRFDPLLSSLVATLGSDRNVEAITRDVRTLSGEDQSRVKESERWVSRHSMSEGGYKAGNWVTDEMSAYGFTCKQLSYMPSFAPMVECTYDDSALGDGDDGAGVATSSSGQEKAAREVKYSANETVVLSAHFDSRGSFGYPTAPGADDDASGTALVLAVARHIHEHRLRFARKLVLCLFSGEEQGLLSSSWYAAQLRARNEDVAFALQVDMVGFRQPGEPMQLARPDVIGLAEAGSLVGNLSAVYVPELVVGYTPACCSDHQSFVTQAYPATWIFERNGPIADPCYHSSCDASDRPGYDFAQVAAHSKVAFAAVWEVAGARMP